MKRARLTVGVDGRELERYHALVLEGRLERGELSRQVRAVLRELVGGPLPGVVDERQTTIPEAE